LIETEATMGIKSTPSPAEDLQRVIESAARLGVEMDEEEALQWLAAIAVADSGQNVVFDVSSGVFGHRASMLDFEAGELEYFRQVGHLVEFYDEPGVVETALAISGSSAQSKIQSYPGDLDFFERVNIKAPTQAEACQVLARIMRQKVLDTIRGETYRLIEVKFGSYPYDVQREDRAIKAGSPIAWLPDEIQRGELEALNAEGAPMVITWDEVSSDPGWCKLDWVVADSVRQQVSNASNMLDVTWEAPDGTVTPMDGYLDPYFQEVYLEAESVPIFSKLVKHMSADALDDYVSQLEKEVRKYVTGDVNYGKAAKRMYNIFRLTGRYEEAAYLRELFDEPTTVLYQVWSLMRTLEEACGPDGTISSEAVLAQADGLIIDVVRVLEGDEEAEIVRYLLRLRDAVSQSGADPERFQMVEAARAEVINLVNNFFYEKLVEVPEIRTYMEGFQSQTSL
jgi:hypothetical protein